MKSLMRPFSILYGQVVTVKNSLYDRGWFFQYQAPCKVISIGNLTMGGTGKTPLTDFCVKELLKLEKSIAVVSRSYRAEADTAMQVDPNNSRAVQIFGDEPLQLALMNPEVDFYVGPSKWQTVRLAASQKSYDVIIVDDGFQHRTLKRDLDIVVVDATESFESYRLIPEGRARENWSSLQRAHCVVVTKCNWTQPQKLVRLAELLQSKKNIHFVDYEILRIKDIRNAYERSFLEMKGQKVFLVSGIGRPEIFENQMSQVMTVLGSKRFRDHHPYSVLDIKNILELYRNSKADFIVTTEKDAVKLKKLVPEDIPLLTAPISVIERGNQGSLHEILSQLVQ